MKISAGLTLSFVGEDKGGNDDKDGRVELGNHFGRSGEKSEEREEG